MLAMLSTLSTQPPSPQRSVAYVGQWLSLRCGAIIAGFCPGTSTPEAGTSAIGSDHGGGRQRGSASLAGLGDSPFQGDDRGRSSGPLSLHCSRTRRGRLTDRSEQSPYRSTSPRLSAATTA